MRNWIRISTALVYTFLFIQHSSAQGPITTDSEPRLIENFVYSMPEEVAAAGIDGDVMIAVLVDEKGSPQNAILIAGPMVPCETNAMNPLALLSSTLNDAIMNLKFAPAIKNGDRIAMKTTLTYKLTNPRLKWPTFEDQVKDGEARGYKMAKGGPNGGLSIGAALSTPKPKYPNVARATKEAGTVLVQVIIDPKGNVMRSGAIKGPLVFQAAAREAACKAKFAPTLLSGIPVRTPGTISYYFQP